MTWTTYPRMVHFVLQELPLFMDRRKGGPHFRNLYGDINLISGHVLPSTAVLRRPYRVTLLNAADSRPWLLQLAYDDNTFAADIAWVIGGDGGYTDAPKPLTYSGLLMGIAERYELVIDFSCIPSGRTVYLKIGFNDDRMGADGKYSYTLLSRLLQSTLLHYYITLYSLALSSLIL